MQQIKLRINHETFGDISDRSARQILSFYVGFSGVLIAIYSALYGLTGLRDNLAPG